jgi:hypothetical protein
MPLQSDLMNTQRTIMLIVFGAIFLFGGVAVGLMLWLGLQIGSLVAGSGIVLLVVAYLLIVRPWHLRWGASKAEAIAAMPGDDLVPGATVSTRAITIGGTPAEVWPWVVQIGFGRAGWYSYDWIDNDGEPSASHIVADLQLLAVGDQIEIIPEMGPNVVTIEPERTLVAAADDRTSSWCLQLVPEGSSTRLISRWRNHFKVTLASALMIALTDPGSFIMEQKMLRTIRDRVEQQEEATV